MPCETCRRALIALVDAWIRQAEHLEAKRRASGARLDSGYWGELAGYLREKRRELA